MEHPLIRAFLAKLEKEEIIPIIPPVPDTNLNEYFDLIERRFLNPKIGDTIPRLAQDGSNRQPKFILPSFRTRSRAKSELGASEARKGAGFIKSCTGSALADVTHPKAMPTITAIIRNVMSSPVRLREKTLRHEQCRSVSIISRP